MNLEFLFEYNIYYLTFRQWYVFFFWPHRRGGGQKYGLVLCWRNKMIKGEEKSGGNVYFSPNLLYTYKISKNQGLHGEIG